MTSLIWYFRTTCERFSNANARVWKRFQLFCNCPQWSSKRRGCILKHFFPVKVYNKQANMVSASTLASRDVNFNKYPNLCRLRKLIPRHSRWPMPSLPPRSWTCCSKHWTTINCAREPTRPPRPSIADWPILWCWPVMRSPSRFCSICRSCARTRTCPTSSFVPSRPWGVRAEFPGQ